MQVGNSIELTKRDHLRYIEAGPKLKDKDKEDWRKFYENQIRNIEAIEKATK